MKKIFLSIIALFTLCTTTANAETWAQICTGSKGAAWYGSEESQQMADLLISMQKTNGGWMKNDQFHALSATEIAERQALYGDNGRSKHSCFDNTATTQEMRFLAKVWQGCKVEKYREAFVKALNLIFTAEQNGGWSQYWPLSGGGSYQDYITFNDDLQTNVMKMLRDIKANKGDFLDIVDDATREKCQQSFDRGLECIMKCQIDDNGVKAAWCAQHDPSDFLPTEGRPHELPSVSGYESASLLSFLMTIEDPSEELQECITSAIKWLDAHKIEGKAIEDYTNAAGQSDRRIVDKAGSAIWGRFIQIGGESGKKIYDKFFKKLKDRNKSRTYNTGGKAYTYTEYEIATTSYDETKAYQPIFSIYTNEYPHLFYRFLYNYEDTDPVVDSKGCPIATSLTPGNRSSYQYLGSWCLKTINTEYPAWKQKIDAKKAAGDATMHELSETTFLSEDEGTPIKYTFADGFTVSNSADKKHNHGNNNTVKYSAAVPYTITIPEGQQVVKVTFYGYDNYNVEAYLASLNGVTYSATDYVFPAKISDPEFVTHTIDISSNPAVGTMEFSFGVKQCCVIITLYTLPYIAGISDVTLDSKADAKKTLSNGRIVIQKNGTTYNAVGQKIAQ